MIIFRFLWAIYGAIAFLLVVILCIPFIFLILSLRIGGRYYRKNALRIINYGSELLMILLLIKIKVHGRKNLDRTKNYIVVSNHPSLLDPPAVAATVQLSMTFLAKQELLKVPFFGFVVRHLTVTVNRNSKEDRAKSIEALKQSLSTGLNIFIAPEGTRNKSGEPLANFYDGAFKIALETKLPLLPVTVVGSAKLLSPFKALQLSPGFMETYIDEPVLILETDDVESLKQKVRNKMLKHLSKN